MTPGSIEDFLPFSTNGIAIASDGSIWQYHPTSPGGMVEIEPPVVPMPPVNLTPPSVQAVTDLVVGSQLASSPGTWNPSGTQTRQWQRGATAIGGATGTNYVLVAADVGAMIGCPVTTTNQDGAVTVPSNTVGPILAAEADPEQTPAQQPQAQHHAKPHKKR